MPLVITNCVVSRADADVLTNPTSADLNNDNTPTAHIIITGGTRSVALVEKAAYKIKGTVNGLERTFLNMKCVNTGDPARFDK